MPCTEKAWGWQILIRDAFWQCWVLLCHGGLVTLFSRWQPKCKRLWAAIQIDLSEILLCSSLGASALLPESTSWSQTRQLLGQCFSVSIQDRDPSPAVGTALFLYQGIHSLSPLGSQLGYWLFALVIKSDTELNTPVSTQESEKPGCRHRTQLRKGLAVQM